MSEYIVNMPPYMPYDIRVELNAWYVESEPIVRCRDCREYNTELYRHITCELLGRYVEPDGFCAWGERMES